MDELFEALTLIQTGKVRNFPVILFNRAYWQGVVNWMRSTMLPGGKLEAKDLDLLMITDSAEEACQRIIDCYNDECWTGSRSSTIWPAPRRGLRRTAKRPRAKPAGSSRHHNRWGHRRHPCISDVYPPRRHEEREDA